jgi:hypothetical protein
MTDTTLYRAVAFRNEGGGIRLLVDYSPVVDSLEQAHADAQGMRRSYTDPAVSVFISTSGISPRSFP